VQEKPCGKLSKKADAVVADDSGTAVPAKALIVPLALLAVALAARRVGTSLTDAY
jgi:hypothetical protein